MPDCVENHQFRGILTRLRGDIAGATAALMAAAMVPTVLIAGSAIDVTRMYVAKVRLQQACDAGALAGRKFLADSNATALDTNAETQAKKFFSSNFKAGWMGSTDVSFTPSKTTDKQVAGTASATVPMTIMATFGPESKTLTATCEARFDVADADIMFVLDITGSMSCIPSASATCQGAAMTYTRSDGSTGKYRAEATGSKIGELREAVMTFYDTMVANADPSTHIRYGFVPYSMNVNVGKLLPASWMVSQWDYQSRRAIGDVNSGSATTESATGIKKTDCQNSNYRSLPATTNDYKFDATNVAYVYSYNKWTESSPGSTTGTCVVNKQKVTPKWRYASWPIDVSQYIAGNSVQDPTMFAASLNKWRGCIEERSTTSSASFDDESLPADLDPDLAATDDASKWRPLWPEVLWNRNANGPNAPAVDVNTQDGSGSGISNLDDSEYVTCNMPASKIATMTRTQVNDYVYNADFKAAGFTYHDIGMIWGLRLLSPTGLFKDTTAAWPGRNPPNRHIIFMTDGFLNTEPEQYTPYGLEKLDRRVTGATGTGVQDDRHNARFKVLCDAAKNRNITVWMIAFGKGGGLSNEMKYCASAGKSYYVDDGAALKEKFKEIATQIAQLRLSK